MMAMQANEAKNELVRPLGGLAIAQCLMSHDIEHTIWVQRIALSDFIFHL